MGALLGASDDAQVHKSLIQTYTAAAAVGHLRVKILLNFLFSRCDVMVFFDHTADFCNGCE